MDQHSTNLRGHTLKVAPDCATEFNELYADNGRFNANDTFVGRKVSQYGDEVYVSFVKKDRNPEHEHFSPYDGTMPARFFVLGL